MQLFKLAVIDNVRSVVCKFCAKSGLLGLVAVFGTSAA